MLLFSLIDKYCKLNHVGVFIEAFSKEFFHIDSREDQEKLADFIYYIIKTVSTMIDE